MSNVSLLVSFYWLVACALRFGPSTVKLQAVDWKGQEKGWGGVK